MIGVLIGATVVTKGVRRVTIAIELDVSERNFAAHKEFAAIFFDVVFPIRSRSNRSRNRLKAVRDTFLNGNDDLVFLIRQHLLNTKKFLPYLSDWIFLRAVIFDILVFINALVEAFNDLSHLLSCIKEKNIIIDPIDSGENFHRDSNRSGVARPLSYPSRKAR